MAENKKNGGGLWKSNAASGRAEVGNLVFQVDVVKTGLTGEKQVKYRAYLTPPERGAATIQVALFPKDDPKKGLGGGRVTLDGVDYWVTLYANDKTDRPENFPDLSLRFNEASAPRSAEPATAQAQEDRW